MFLGVAHKRMAPCRVRPPRPDLHAAGDQSVSSAAIVGFVLARSVDKDCAGLDRLEQGAADQSGFHRTVNMH